MKNEKPIPSLLEEDNTALPSRGGNYISDEEILKSQYETTIKDCRREINIMRDRIYDAYINRPRPYND